MAVAYFGQAYFCQTFLATTYFGHDLFWPRPILATTYFGHDLFWPRPTLATARLTLASTFNLANLGRFWSGQADIGQLCPPTLVWPRWVMAWPILGVLADFDGAKPISANTPTLRRTTLRRTALRRTALRRTALRRTALRRTALRRTAQNFALVFPFPAPLVILFFSLWGCSRGILVQAAGGFHTTTRRRKQAHLRSRPTKTPTFHEKTSRERKKDTRRHPERAEKTREDCQRETKRMKMGAGEGKKSAKFWASHPWDPPFECPKIDRG